MVVGIHEINKGINLFRSPVRLQRQWKEAAGGPSERFAKSMNK